MVGRPDDDRRHEERIDGRHQAQGVHLRADESRDDDRERDMTARQRGVGAL
jgi:hypothetical protein